MTAKTVDLRLPPRPEALSEAREELRSLGLQRATFEALRLLVTELMTYGLRAAADGEAPDEIRVRAAVNGRTVKVEVAPFPAHLPPAADRVDLLDPVQTGVMLLDQLADRWGVDARGAWLELGRDPAAEAIERSRTARERLTAALERAHELHAQAARTQRQLDGHLAGQPRSGRTPFEQRSERARHRAERARFMLRRLQVAEEPAHRHASNG